MKRRLLSFTPAEAHELGLGCGGPLVCEHCAERVGLIVYDDTDFPAWDLMNFFTPEGRRILWPLNFTEICEARTAAPPGESLQTKI